jgi:hypothetical protein
MANGYPEIEDQEGTRIEKVLLAALVAFLLVGGFWALSRIEGYFPEPVLTSYEYLDQRILTVSVEEELGVNSVRGRVERLQRIANNRRTSLAKAVAAEAKAGEAYRFRREEYRTAMQAGNVTESQRSAYDSSRIAYQHAKEAIAPLQMASDEAEKGMAREDLALRAAQQRARDVFDSRSFQRNIRLFAFHFSFAGMCLGVSWILWQAGRRRRWRYLTILTALFTASVLQLLFLLFRYCWELFLEDYAALGISLLGTALCILAIVGIKRWLFSPERLAQARLADRRCTVCATPFSESQTHCWNCGRPLVERCQSCGANRLLFAPHCGSCGADAEVQN